MWQVERPDAAKTRKAKPNRNHGRTPRRRTAKAECLDKRQFQVRPRDKGQGWVVHVPQLLPYQALRIASGLLELDPRLLGDWMHTKATTRSNGHRDLGRQKAVNCRVLAFR